MKWSIPFDVIVAVDRSKTEPAPGNLIRRHGAMCYACGQSNPDGLRLDFYAGYGVSVQTKFSIGRQAYGTDGHVRPGILSAAILRGRRPCATTDWATSDGSKTQCRLCRTVAVLRGCKDRGKIGRRLRKPNICGRRCLHPGRARSSGFGVGSLRARLANARGRGPPCRFLHGLGVELWPPSAVVTQRTSAVSSRLRRSSWKPMCVR